MTEAVMIRHDLPIARVYPNTVEYAAEIRHPVKWFSMLSERESQKREVSRLKALYLRSIEKERE